MPSRSRFDAIMIGAGGVSNAEWFDLLEPVRESSGYSEMGRLS